MVQDMDWVARVNRAIDLVLETRDAPRDLAEVARAVHSSPYHFHRVFRSVVGETLHSFQKRVRLERALHLMAHSPRMQLTDVALATGFADSSSFSKAFKAQYGSAPSRFDLDGWRAARRDQLNMPGSGLHFERLPPGQNPDGFRVVEQLLPARAFATLRVPNPFQPGRVTGAFETLVAWAEARDLADGAWFGWMWEDPTLVPLEQCRYDAAVEVPADTPVDEGVTLQRFGPMRVARLTVEGDILLEQRALDWLYGTWLPRSGYEPAPLPCFEAWHGRPFAHGVEHFALDLHLPIVGGPGGR